MPNIETILRDNVSLQIECVDRIYMNAYVPGVQRPGQLVYFLTNHRGNWLPSPALLRQMSDAFVASIKRFAEHNRIPIVQFRSGERKDEIAKRRYAQFRGDEGVVFIGVAQELDSVFRTKPRKGRSGKATFDFFRSKAAVNQYYFYIIDREFGPGFIKLSSYAPFGGRVCLNGHEWAKCQLRKAGVTFEPLSNGFLSCAEPERLQRICDRLDANDIERYFRKWLARLPHPFTAKDRKAGYRYRLSIWQMEFSLTQVFDKPLHGRQLFEELVRENLDLGRPDRIQLLFDRRIMRTGPSRTPSSFRTRVINNGVQPKLSVEYKHSKLKQYFKDNRALRTETTINNAYDFDVRRDISKLPVLRDIARNINRRLITLERTSHNCAISKSTFESFVLPSDTSGQHVPGLRFGDPRVMALLLALCLFLPCADGLTNRLLRERVGALYDPGPKGYTAGRMTYDLRRLRLKGLIERLPHRSRYMLTPRGRRLALFLCKSYARIFRPGVARLDPGLPDSAGDPLARAWRQLDQAIDHEIKEAKLAA